MNFRTSNVLLFLCLAGLTMLLSCAAQNTSRSAGHSLATGSGRSADDLADKILNNPDLPFVLEKARSILKKGLTAGSGYGEVWIRDLNTFIEIALESPGASGVLSFSGRRRQYNRRLHPRRKSKRSI
ncbi:MAG: hypothetical protein ACYSUD_23785 [Planctomycetota bacterium]|jgi:hypothetical protein